MKASWPWVRKKGGVRSYISPGDNGFLLDTSSWESIIRDLEEILYEAARPPEAYREIIRKGQEMIQERYAMETVAKAYLAFYQRIKKEPMANRFVILSPPFYSHFQPLLELGRRLREQGCPTVLACTPEFREAVLAAGLEFYPLALSRNRNTGNAEATR